MDGAPSSSAAAEALADLKAKDLEGKVINVMMLSEDAVGAAIEVLLNIKSASGSLEALFREHAVKGYSVGPAVLAAVASRLYWGCQGPRA